MKDSTIHDCMLRLEGLKCPFGDAPGLEDLSFDVAVGERFFVLGPSGAGKSTLLRAIAGLDVPRTGRIAIEGRVVNDPKIRVPPEKRGLQMVFQDLALWPHMTIGQQLVFAAGGKRVADAGWMDRVLGLTKAADFEKRYPHELSGGEKQRAALARALAPRPKLLLLDEPMRHMDPVLARGLRQEIRSIFSELSITAVFVTHDQEEAFDLADRILLLRDGRIEAMGTPSALLDAPPTEYTAEFLGRTRSLRLHHRDVMASE